MAIPVNPAVCGSILVLLALANTGGGQEHVRVSAPRTFEGKRLIWMGDATTSGQQAFAAVAVQGRQRLSQAPRQPIEIPYEGHIAGLQAWWSAAFDSDNLYVLVRTNLPDAVFRTPRGGDEYGGDLFEVFVDPSGSGKHKYQFCANPVGLRYDSYQDQKSWDAGWAAAGVTDARGWEVRYTIPWDVFGDSFASDTRHVAINVGLFGSGQHVSWTGQWGDPGSYGRLVLGAPVRSVSRALDLGIRLDRKVYDSLDVTAQAIVAVDGELPDQSQLDLSIWTKESRVFHRQIPVAQTGAAWALVFDLRELAVGPYELRVGLVRDDTVLARALTRFSLVPLVQGATRPPLSGTIPILIQPNAAAAGEQILTTGVPLPRGTALSTEHFKLTGPHGAREIPLQIRVSSRWSPRGYIKWLLLDFPGRVSADSVTKYRLHYGPEVTRVHVSNPLKIEQDQNRIQVDTGPLQFSVRKRGFSFLESAIVNGQQLIDGSRITLTDEHGTVSEAAGDFDARVVIEEAGPLRAVIAAHGWFVAEGKRTGKYVMRIYAYRGEPLLRVFHTFIVTTPTKTLRYRNIALESHLTKAGRVLFGIAGAPPVAATGPHAYLIQESYDRLRVAEVREGREAELAIAKQSAGWVQSGGVGVAVRDVWQNFPKELEVENQMMRVHFWPRHSGTPRHPPQAVNARDIHMLWFAHEGKLLDFSIPKEYAQFHDKDDANTHEFYYIPAAIKNQSDEALGIAKTHEMVWTFGADEHEAGRQFSALTQDIGCLPAPQWIGKSGAVGMLHPLDREQFPDVETALSRHFDWLQRSTEYMHDYGMWNFGDRHSRWDPANKRVPVNRTWANHHHGNPRTYWLLYLRSGDPKYLTAARRQALHLMDVDICHYSTPEYEAKGYPVGKIPGALCDYKGLVHWHSGNRLYDYNNLSDYLFYDYYLTGYRRAVDVARETADSVARFPRGGNSGRDGEGPVASLCFLYEATWDARLLPQLQTYVASLLESQTDASHELGPGAFPGWAGYAPWLPRYIHLARDPIAIRSLEKWCDFVTDNAFYGSGGAMWHDLTEGYRRFGKREYLSKGMAEMKLMLSDQFLQPGHFYDGFFTPALTLAGGYFSQRMPGFLAALASAERPLPPRYGISYYAPGMISMWLHRKSHYASQRYYKRWQGLPIVVARESADRTFRFTLKGALAPGRAWVTRGSDGVEVARASLQEEETILTVAADGDPGEYVLWVASDSDRPQVDFPVSDLHREVFAWHLLVSRRMQAMFFKTRRDARQAVINVAFGYDAGQAMVLRADGREVARVADGEMARARWNDLVFPVGPELRGELLHFIHGRNHDETEFYPAEGILPWLSLTPERYFTPQVELDPRRREGP